MQIIPSVLTNDFLEAEKQIKYLSQFTNWIQSDVIDGVFSNYKTFELELLSKIKIDKTVLWDIHLMVKEPEKWLEKCLFVGASRVVGQVEMMSDRESFVAKAKNMAMEAGLALEPETPVINIPDETDIVLLMGRKSGVEKAEFNEKVLEKVSSDFVFAVDGGVNKDNLEIIEKAGVEIVYSGHSYFDLIKNAE